MIVPYSKYCLLCPLKLKRISMPSAGKGTGFLEWEEGGGQGNLLKIFIGLGLYFVVHRSY